MNCSPEKVTSLASPETLSVTHIFDGEEVITGGDDGQIWMATFASRNAAEHFVRYCVERAKTFGGERPQRSCHCRQENEDPETVRVVGELGKALAARDGEIQQLRSALEMLYDKWENGEGCYQDPEDCTGYLGNAFRLTSEEEKEILALIPKCPTSRPAVETTVPSLADRLRDRVGEIRKGLGAGSLGTQSSIERSYGDPLLDAVLDAIDEELEACR